MTGACMFCGTRGCHTDDCRMLVTSSHRALLVTLDALRRLERALAYLESCALETTRDDDDST